MRKVCLVILLMVVCCCAWAGEVQYKMFASQQDCKTKCEEFMSLTGAGRVDEALRRLEPFWPFSSAEFTQVQLQTTKQMGLVKPRFGKAVGHEFVREEMINNTVLRLTYIQKCERHVIRWIFIFYKPGDKWLLNSFSWDDKIARLFD